MRRFIGMAAAGAVALAVTVGLAASAPARETATKVLTIPAASLVARDDSTHNGNGPPGCSTQVASANGQEFQGVLYQSSGSFTASVLLPQNATVHRLSLWVHDNTSPEDVALFLVRKHFAVGQNFVDGYSVMAQVSSAGADANIQEFATTTVVNPIIKNGANTYFVEVVNCDPAATIEPIAVQIEYAT
jgi:hypothetical protein